jgi:hypothetical protein
MVRSRKGADSREVDQFRLRQRFLDDDLAVLDDSRGAHVLLDHVVGGEARLVLPGLEALARDATHEDLDEVGAVELRDPPAREHVAHAGSDAAVGDHGHAVFLREFVQGEEVVGHEGDVAHRRTGADGGLHRPVAQRRGQGSEHDVM